MGLLVLAAIGFARPFAAFDADETDEVRSSAQLANASELKNVVEVTPRLISGSAPADAAAFRELAERGVKTIISVDGARPDVAAARKHGIRYVHLPVGYDGIEATRQFAIARAIRDLPGPVYLHCHRGKHRGPTAAASAAVLLGQMAPDDANAFLERVGTSRNYPGLYRCVARLQPASPADIDNAPNDFPEISTVTDFVAAMAEMQEVYDHLAQIRGNDWKTPADHPDLVPIAEAGRLENLLRSAAQLADTKSRSDDFQKRLHETWKHSQALEAALMADKPIVELSQQLKSLHDSCVACHRVYRN